MYSIENVSEEIYKSVINDNCAFNHNSLVIVGDNASGKTTLLKNLLRLAKKEYTDKFYFIDSLNRRVYGSDVKNQESGVCYSDFKPDELLKERGDDSFFSKEDVFLRSAQGSMVTYSELCANIGKYETLFNRFFPCKIERENSLGESSIISGSKILTVNGVKIDSLSSSQAAKIRLIMEIEYAQRCKCKMVIIDEFDDHFDAENLVKFIEQLRENYPQMRFLFTIHSFEILVQLSGMDAIVYNNPDTAPIDISIIDCDDITEVGQVSKIRAKYITSKSEEERFLSNCVTSCIKKGGVSKEQEAMLIEIDRNSLNVKSRVLFDYVLRYLKNEAKDKN